MSTTTLTTTTCPSWCTGEMHQDGELDHCAELGGAGHVQVDLILHSDADAAPFVRVWLYGNAVDANVPADPDGLWDLAEAARAAHQRLVEIRTSSRVQMLDRRIVAAMSDHQVTAEDLAKTIGRSERYVLKCLRRPGQWGAAELVEKVAPALGVSWQALFEGT